jgi:hypothetical protein
MNFFIVQNRPSLSSPATTTMSNTITTATTTHRHNLHRNERIPRSPEFGRKRISLSHYPRYHNICRLYPSTLSVSIMRYLLLVRTGSERACKTMFHDLDVQFSLHFVFASVLVAAYSKDRSRRNTVFTHHGTPVLAMHSIA